MSFKEIVKLARALGFTTKAARAIAQEICAHKAKYARLLKVILATPKVDQKPDPRSISFLF